MANSETVSIPYRTSRAKADELKRRAASLGYTSVQAYMDRALALDPDALQQRIREATLAGYARTHGSASFDLLDEQLAAVPRSAPSELGFDPAAHSQAAA